MSLYTRGHVSIGAEDLPVTAYRKAADAIAAARPEHSHGVLGFTKNSLKPDEYRFDTPEGATGQYDLLSERPGQYVYVYLYRDNKPIDEAYFTATSEREVQVKKEIRKERVGLGWILGGVGVGLLGMAMFRKRS